MSSQPFPTGTAGPGGPATSTSRTESQAMTWNQIEDNWMHLQGKVRQHWGRLSTDDIARIAGRRDSLAGWPQERYGIAAGEAERDIEAFTRTLGFRAA